MAPFNHFDFIAPYYDRFIKPTGLDDFSSLLLLPVSGLLLDLGGGTGRKSYPLLKMAGGIVIADSSKGMLREARKKGGLVEICAESERLPFVDASFARIMMVDALHHVLDYHLTLQEIWRIIMPGGRILIEEPDIQATPTKIMAIFERIALMRSHFVNPQEIAASFNFPHAKTEIRIESTTAWILIDKPAA